jgi:hypothetical protein
MSALKTPLERLQETPIEIDEITNCHVWQGRVSDTGYAMSGVYKAYRLTWEVANGPIPDGLYVLHTCDNRRCVNPEHLTLGTHADNMEDMRVKGRAFPQLGETNGNAKLDEATVRQIKKALQQASTTLKPSSIYRNISREFNITYAMAYHIAVGRNWSHVS